MAVLTQRPLLHSLRLPSLPFLSTAWKRTARLLYLNHLNLILTAVGATTATLLSLSRLLRPWAMQPSLCLPPPQQLLPALPDLQTLIPPTTQLMTEAVLILHLQRHLLLLLLPYRRHQRKRRKLLLPPHSSRPPQPPSPPLSPPLPRPHPPTLHRPPPLLRHRQPRLLPPLPPLRPSPRSRLCEPCGMSRASSWPRPRSCWH